MHWIIQQVLWDCLSPIRQSLEKMPDEALQIFPGIQLFFNCCLADEISFHHSPYFASFLCHTETLKSREIVLFSSLPAAKASEAAAVYRRNNRFRICPGRI